MKLLVALFACAALAAAAAAAELVEPQRFYHESVGVAEAARIKRAEERADAADAAGAAAGQRIIGGSAAALGQYPHMGGLVITLTTGATSVCGSSLLSNTRAVTAAHCWWDGRWQARQFVVVLGSLRLFTGGVRVTTTQVELHGSWNTNNLNNDIAIITHSWVSFTNAIQPVALPTNLNNNYEGSWAQAAGFGRTGDNNPIGNNQVLSHVTLQVISNAMCQAVFGPSVIGSTLCTSGAGGTATCSGDSGGPLTVGSAPRVLIGVVSFGAAATCQGGFPSGYARVTSFAPWLRARL